MAVGRIAAAVVAVGVMLVAVTAATAGIAAAAALVFPVLVFAYGAYTTHARGTGDDPTRGR
jgi:hypothetical protein